MFSFDLYYDARKHKIKSLRRRYVRVREEARRMSSAEVESIVETLVLDQQVRVIYWRKGVRNWKYIYCKL